MRKSASVLFGLLTIAALCPAHAQELNVFAGGVHDTDRSHTSYSYQLEYMQPLSQHLAASFGYLNEGHLPIDRRDGYPLQLWGRTGVLDDRLTLSAGLGPYWYLDTHLTSLGGDFVNDHSFGGIFSLDAAWHTSSRWLLHARANWIDAHSSFNSTTFSVGAGYLLSSDWCATTESKALGCPGWTTGKELTVYGGTEVINSFDHQERSATGCLEYRQGIARNADWTVSINHENNSLLARETGVMTQLWAVRPVSGEEWRLGVGAGPYVGLGRNDNVGEPNPQRVCGVISATAARRLNDRWDLRLTWNRVVTNDSRDADQLMIGLGYNLSAPEQ